MQTQDRKEVVMEQNKVLGFLGALFQKNAPLTDEVYTALKGCLKPRNLDEDDYISGETVRIRAAIDSLGRRHGKNLDAYVEYQTDEDGNATVFLIIESEDGHWSSRHSKLTFKISEDGYASTILECSSRNGEDWYSYQIPTMLGVGCAYYALLAWEEYQGIKNGRLDAIPVEDDEDDWNDSYLKDFPEALNDGRTEEECLTAALMILAQDAEEISDDDDEDEEEGDE